MFRNSVIYLILLLFVSTNACAVGLNLGNGSLAAAISRANLGNGSTAQEVDVYLGNGSTADCLTCGGTSVFLNDTFTEASSVEIASHSPETGGTWTQLAVTAGQAVLVSGGNGYVYNSSTGSDIVYNSASPASADYTVEGDVVVGSTLSDRLGGVCVRIQADKSAYCAVLNGTGVFRIAEYTASTVDVQGGATLASANYGPSGANTYVYDSTYHITISIVGGDITATCGLGAALTANDTTIISAGKAGFAVRRNASKIYSIEGY